jgi:hypothetical protein
LEHWMGFRLVIQLGERRVTHLVKLWALHWGWQRELK